MTPQSKQAPRKPDGETKAEKPSLTKNILTILAFAIVVIIGVWGAVNIMRLIPSLYSSLVSPSAKSGAELSIIAPTQTSSGVTVAVSWEHDARDDGLYTFSYQCRPNLTVSTPTAEDAATSLACDTPYTLPANSEKTVRITPRSTVPQVDTSLSVSYIDEDGDIIARNTAPITILNTEAPSDGGGANGGKAGQLPRPIASDLRVRIIDFGILNPNTRAFIPQSIVRPNDIAAVRFEVANIGGRATGAWDFTATLPTSPSRTYQSILQQSLNPGDRIVYTLSFSTITTGGGTFRITADPSNRIAEANESNNTVTYTASPASGY